MQSWIEGASGKAGSFGRTMKKYMDKFETKADESSKAIFKKIKLPHWSPTSQMIMTLLVVVGPACFVFVAMIAITFIFFYNKLMLALY